MVSKSTEGRVKRIYAESDAAEQLRNFYREISTPVMYDLNFMYDENIIDIETVTQNKFPQFFDGGEILMAGKLRSELLDINLVGDRKNRSNEDREPRIIRCGVGMEGFTTQPVDFYTVIEVNASISLTTDDYSAHEIDCLHTEEPVYQETSNKTWVPHQFAERMWANLKIKTLLKISEFSKDLGKKAKAEKSAVCLALKYHLVTPVTSLLITQDNPPPRAGLGERGLSSSRAMQQSSSMSQGQLGIRRHQAPAFPSGPLGAGGAFGLRGTPGVHSPNHRTGSIAYPGPRGQPATIQVPLGTESHGVHRLLQAKWCLQ